MSDFDPYYQWLAISPQYQPPNYYRLLGVELFESNSDVILNAAYQRMAHIRSFQIGKHADLSQKLLNELAAAKICLLNPIKKAAYDRQVRQRSAVPETPLPVLVPDTDGLDFFGMPTFTPGEISEASITSEARREPGVRRKKRKGPSPLGIVVASMAGLFVAMAVFSWMRGNAEDVGRTREQASLGQDKATTPGNGGAGRLPKDRR